MPFGKSEPRHMRTDCDWPPAAGTGIWNFSTGLAGSVASMIMTPFSSTGLPPFSGLGLLPPWVPANAIVLPSGYTMTFGWYDGRPCRSTWPTRRMFFCSPLWLRPRWSSANAQPAATAKTLSMVAFSACFAGLALLLDANMAPPPVMWNGRCRPNRTQGLFRAIGKSGGFATNVAQNCSRQARQVKRGRTSGSSQAARLDSARLAPAQLAHRGDQVFEVERLHERLHRAGLARDLEQVVIPQRFVAGHGDDLHLGKLPAQVADGLDALLFRHEDVGDDYVGRPRTLQLQSLNAVGGAFGFDAVVLKPPQRELPEVVVVVDDENVRHVPEKEGGMRILCHPLVASGIRAAPALFRRHQRERRGRYPETCRLSRA